MLSQRFKENRVRKHEAWDDQKFILMKQKSVQRLALREGKKR